MLLILIIHTYYLVSNFITSLSKICNLPLRNYCYQCTIFCHLFFQSKLSIILLQTFFFQGEEADIKIRIDNTDAEIDLIFTFFFYQRTHLPYAPLSYVYIDITFPEKHSIKMLQTSFRSCKDVNTSVKSILMKNFNVYVRDEDNITKLQIPPQELAALFREANN